MAWVHTRRLPTPPATGARASSSRSCGIISRRSARRRHRCGTGKACQDSSSGSFASSSRVDISPRGSRAFSATVAGTIASCRSRARDGASVRVVVDGPGQDIPGHFTGTFAPGGVVWQTSEQQAVGVFRNTTVSSNAAFGSTNLPSNVLAGPPWAVGPFGSRVFQKVIHILSPTHTQDQPEQSGIDSVKARQTIAHEVGHAINIPLESRFRSLSRSETLDRKNRPSTPVPCRSLMRSTSWVPKDQRTPPVASRWNRPRNELFGLRTARASGRARRPDG